MGKRVFWRTKKNSASLIVPSMGKPLGPTSNHQQDSVWFDEVSTFRWGLSHGVLWPIGPFHSSMAPWLVTRRSHLFIKFKTWLNMFSKIAEGVPLFLGGVQAGFCSRLVGEIHQSIFNTPFVSLWQSLAKLSQLMGKLSDLTGPLEWNSCHRSTWMILQEAFAGSIYVTKPIISPGLGTSSRPGFLSLQST